VHPTNNIFSDGGRIEYGFKLLGSFVGSDEFIRNSVKDKNLELSNLADRLIRFINFRLLLFRWCFIPKIHYLFRTISPQNTEHIISDIDEMKSKVLATIFGKHFLTSPEYDTVFWLSCATVKEGGLGLSFASHIAKSAFVTSMIEYDRSSNILNRIYDLIHHYGSNNPLFVLHSSS
jgi:hypothetical protein